MSRRFGKAASIAALALLSVSLLLPLAAADHAYSHRLVIYGRVVDAEGNAVQGYTVDLLPEHVKYEGTCSPNQPDTETEAFGPTYTKPVTNEYGEFIFCLHAHSMSRFEPGQGNFKVTTPQGQTVAESRTELNGFSRVVFHTIQLPTTVPNAPATLEETYTVVGRLWNPSSEQKIEGVTVFGDTVKHETVNVTLTYDDGRTATATTTTNGYGDFSVRVPVEERPTGGTVKIEAAGRAFEAPVSAAFGMTTFDARYGENESPGATVGVLLAAVVAAVALASPLRRRKQP